MYYNDLVSRSVKNCIKKRKPYKEIKRHSEATPLLKNNNNTTWGTGDDVKVQVEGTTETTLSSSSSASTSDSEYTLMDGIYI